MVLTGLAGMGVGVNAGVMSDNLSQDTVWSGNRNGIFVAGSGDNPWALPQVKKERPPGPAYKVNPHYVTPEDIQADSLPKADRRPRTRGSAPAETPAINDRYGFTGIPYGMNYMPGYSIPGYGGYYGGYYGGLPGIDGGLPGLGADPLLFPYGGGVDMGDPYNLMMQPYSTGNVRESN